MRVSHRGTVLQVAWMFPLIEKDTGSNIYIKWGVSLRIFADSVPLSVPNPSFLFLTYTPTLSQTIQGNNAFQLASSLVRQRPWTIVLSEAPQVPLKYFKQRGTDVHACWNTSKVTLKKGWGEAAHLYRVEVFWTWNTLNWSGIWNSSNHGCQKCWFFFFFFYWWAVNFLLTHFYLYMSYIM